MHPIESQIRRNIASDAGLVKLMRDVAQTNLQTAAARAKADPRGQRFTRVFAPGVSTSYRYWRKVKNGKGQRVLFAWSCHRNAAGYFLGWRQVEMKNGTVKRDQWAARKSRKALQVLAERRTKREEARPFRGLGPGWQGKLLGGMSVDEIRTAQKAKP